MKALAAGAAALGVVAAIGWLMVSAGPSPSDRPSAAEVNARIMSPFCPGLTLESCPTDQAGQLREQVRRRVAAGDTNAEIDKWLADQYGRAVLGSARPGAARLIPALMLLSGAGVVALVLFRSSKKPSAPAEKQDQDEQRPPAADGEQRRRLREELARFARGTE